MRKLYILTIVLLASLQATNVYARQFEIDPGGDPGGGGQGYSVYIFGNGSVSQNTSNTYYAYYMDQFGSTVMPPFGLTESWLATNGAYQDPFGGGYGNVNIIFPNQGVSTIMYEASDFYDYYYASYQVSVGPSCDGITPTASPGSRCGTGSVTLTAGNAPSGFGYRWYDSNQTTLLSSSQNFTTPSLSSNKTYYLAYAAGTCTTTKIPVQVTISGPPTRYTVEGGGSVCSGGSVPISLSGSQSGYTYQLIRSGGLVESKTGNGGIVVFSPQSVSGTYAVQAISPAGCNILMFGSASVVIQPRPTIYTVGGGGTVCASDSGVGVTLSGSQSGVTYSLRRNGSFVKNMSGTGGSLNFGAQTVSGTYTVIATNATTGCTSTMSGSASVTINPIPNLYTLSGGGSYCSGGSGFAFSLSGSQSGVNYTLRRNGSNVTTLSGNGGALSFATQTTAGTYTVLATNATTGCTRVMSGSPVITVNPLPNVYTLSGGGTACTLENTNPIVLSGSQIGVTYSLRRNGVLVTNASGTGGVIDFGEQYTSGTYTVVASSSAGCARNMTGSVNVTINNAPTSYTVSGAGSICAGQAGLSISLSGSQSGVNYTLRRNGTNVVTKSGTGSALSFDPQTTAGTYTVLATNATTSCSILMSGSPVITVNALPTNYTVFGGGAHCAGEDGNEVRLSGSQSGITYALKRNGTIVSYLSGTGSALNFGYQTTAGTYTVDASNSSTGCVRTMTGSASVAINSLPTAYTVGGGGVYCSGDAGLPITLSGSQSGVTYLLKLWGETVSSAPGNGSALNFGVQSGIGAYTVVATNAAGCSVDMTGSASIGMYDPLNNYTTSGGGTICSGGGGLTISLSGSQTGVNYALKRNGTTVNQFAGTGNPLNFTGHNDAGTYTIEATNVNTGCTRVMSGTATVTVNPLPTAYTVGGGGTICSGESPPAVTLSDSQSGVNYTLKRGSTTVTTLPGTGNALNFGIQSSSGTYTVVATNATTGCVRTMSGSATITINALPTNFSVGGGGAFCTGDAGLPVTLSGSQSGISYALKRGSTTVTTLSGTGSALNFGNQTVAGTYTIEATNVNTGCTRVMSGTATVTVNLLPTTYTVGGGGTICSGESPPAVTLSDSQSGVNYTLKRGSTTVSTLPGTGNALNFGIQSSSGTYTVVATNATTGCVRTMSGSATITINALPTNFSVGGGGAFCTGDAGLPVTLSGSQSGISYALKRGSTTVSTLSGTGSALNFGNQTVAGTYTVVATSTNGCIRTMSGSATITVNALPSNSISFTGNSRFGAGSVTISISNPQPGVTYEWFSSSSSTTVLATGTSYTATASASSTTFRYVRAKNANNCVSARVAVPVTVYPTTTIAATNGGVLSMGQATVLSSSATYTYDSYQWSREGTPVVGTSATYTATQPGIYTLSVTKAGQSYTTPSITVSAGVSAQNLNYIISNTILDENIKDEGMIASLDRSQNEQTIQYFDGLGRLMQTVSTASSPTGHDIVTPTVYDALGREAKKYLPMVSNQSNGFFKSDILTGPTGTYTGSPHEAFYGQGETAKLAADAMPYATTIFEPSPLNRPLKQGNPGAAWQADGTHAMSYVYAFNQANEVLQFSYDPVNQVVTAGTVGNLSYYAANQLKADQMIDEEQTITISYVDKMGKTLAKKIKKTGEETMTYYVYDVFDQLAVVIPPQAVKLLDTQYHGQSVTDQQSFLSKWAYRYTYDGRKRMITKEVPGAGKTYMVYDKRDRLVLTQDAEQRKDSLWLYTKYDGLNRAVMTGMYQAASVMSQADMAAQVAATISERYTGAGDHGYSNDAFPTQDVTVYTVSYYDDYQFKSKLQNTGGLNMNYQVTHLTGLPSNYSTRTINLVTGSKERVLATEKFIEVVNYYDERQRVVQVVKNNHLDEEERSSTRYKNLINPQVMASKTTYGGEVNITRGFQYDPAGRLLSVQHQVDNGDVVTLTANEYNALGEVVTKHQHGTSGSYAQSIDYRYNIRGWLTRINHADLRQEGAAAADYFGMELGYDNNLGLGSQGQYNGNISAMKWSRDLGDVSLGYGYSYDFLNRLTNADLRTSSNWSSTTTALQTGYSYDANGNILTLNRRDQSGTLIDTLVYDYGTNAAYSNQLLAVTDNSQNDKGFKDGNTTNDDYVYDSNGNLIADLNKNIVEISYNYLNLPDTVYFGDGRQINYLYSATGQKLQQWSVGPDIDRKTDYTGELVYESDTLQLILHEEGRITFDNGLSYEYFLKDHLGNVRVSYTTNPSVEVAQADLEQTPDDFGDGGTIISNGHYNSTPGGNQSLRLSGVEGEIIGLSKSLQVMAGDTVKLSVKAIYPQIDPGAASTDIGSYMAAGFLNSFGIESAPEQSDLYELFGDLFMSGPIFTGNSDTSIPRAYLNYLVFDEQMSLVDMGFRQVSAAGQTDGTTGTHETLSADVTISKSGFVFVYLSNESGQVSEVFFDDMRVELAHGPLLQETGYYPFGLETYQSNASGMTAQRYLYNGVESQVDFGLKLNHTLFRMYDPSLGRFTSIDPLGDFFQGINPYNFGLNNPISFSDPDGLSAILDLWRKVKEGVMSIAGYRLTGSWKANNHGWEKRPRSRGSRKYSPSSSSRNNSNTNSSTNSNPDSFIDYKPLVNNFEIENSKPVINIERPSINIPEIMSRKIGTSSVDPGTKINFDHSPFGSNDYVILDKTRTQQFLDPIVKQLKDNPHLAITIQLLTTLPIDGLSNKLRIINTHLTGSQLLKNRGLAIQQALIDMGVDSRQIVFMNSPGRKKVGVNIIFRKR